jgi:hypothetical protein
MLAADVYRYGTHFVQRVEVLGYVVRLQIWERRIMLHGEFLSTSAH